LYNSRGRCLFNYRSTNSSSGCSCLFSSSGFDCTRWFSLLFFLFSFMGFSNLFTIIFNSLRGCSNDRFLISSGCFNYSLIILFNNFFVIFLIFLLFLFLIIFSSGGSSGILILFISSIFWFFYFGWFFSLIGRCFCWILFIGWGSWSGIIFLVIFNVIFLDIFFVILFNFLLFIIISLFGGNWCFNISFNFFFLCIILLISSVRSSRLLGCIIFSRGNGLGIWFRFSSWVSSLWSGRLLRCGVLSRVIF